MSDDYREPSVRDEVAATRGLLDVHFRRVVGPAVIPVTYIAGIVAVVSLSIGLCVEAFQISTLVGAIAVVCFPVVVVAGIALVRLLVEVILVISTFSGLMDSGVRLVYGFRDTLEEVVVPSSKVAAGIRAARFWEPSDK